MGQAVMNFGEAVAEQAALGDLVVPAVIAEVVDRLAGTPWAKAAVKAAPKVAEWAAEGALPKMATTGTTVISGDNGVYKVNRNTCSCPAGIHGVPCWHVTASVMAKAIAKVEGF